ncbi:MAG: hypothetical protein PWR32_723 [Candidatus Woesearchaeota archaeon]|nr:hypothetical protein [Candidatus Woesearchaeota archaeon]
MNHRKGQAAIFLIVGFLLLGLVITFMFISLNSMKNKESSEEINFNVFKNSLSDCLTQKLENGIFLASRQGGNIYRYQGGATKYIDNKNLFLHFNAYDIPIDIRSMTRKKVLKPYQIFERVTGFPFNCSEPYNITYNTTFNPKPGCDFAYKFNSQVSSDDLKGRFKDRFKKNLETYLYNQFPECLNSIMSDRSLGQNFEIVKEERDKLNISVFFRDYDAEAVFNYPIILKKKGTSEIKEFNTFKAIVNGRFNDLFKLIEEVVYNETHFANYEPSVNKDGFSVRVIRDPDKSNKGSDIISFVYNKTIIFGENLTFYIGRDNRPPLIYELPKSDGNYLINLTWYREISEALDNAIGECNQSKFQGILGNFLYKQTGFIKAIDPDNDFLEYSDNIEDYKLTISEDDVCTSDFPYYFNYNVTDGEYNVTVYIILY